MKGGLTDRLLSDDIIPTGGGLAICGCGAVQERSGTATCDRCAEVLAALNESPQRPALVGVNRHLVAPTIKS